MTLIQAIRDLLSWNSPNWLSLLHLHYCMSFGLCVGVTLSFIAKMDLANLECNLKTYHKSVWETCVILMISRNIMFDMDDLETSICQYQATSRGPASNIQQFSNMNQTFTCVVLKGWDDVGRWPTSRSQRPSWNMTIGLWWFNTNAWKQLRPPTPTFTSIFLRAIPFEILRGGADWKISRTSPPTFLYLFND